MKLFSIALGDKNAYDKIYYPAGELQVRLNSESNAKLESSDKVAVTARLNSADAILELCMLCSALQASGNKRPVFLILPYLPYARADRRFVDGDCFGLQVFANILNSLKVSVLSLDVHSPKSAELITGLIDLSPAAFIEAAISDLGKIMLQANDTSKPTLLFPDEGARKRYAHIGAETGMQVLHCTKVRDKKSGKLSAFSVPPKEEFSSKFVLLVDDICHGGGTFLGVADALHAYDLSLSLYITHGIFSKGLSHLLNRFQNIWTTDSFESKFVDSKLNVFSTSGNFANYLSGVGV